MKRLFIAGGLVAGLGLVIACSDGAQSPPPATPPAGGSTAQAGSGGAAAGMGGSGGAAAGMGGTGGTAGAGGGSPCAMDCAAIGQICDPMTAMCKCPNFNPDHCPALNICTDFRDETAYFTTAFDLILSLYQLPPNHPAVADLRESLRRPEMR